MRRSMPPGGGSIKARRCGAGRGASASRAARSPAADQLVDLAQVAVARAAQVGRHHDVGGREPPLDAVQGDDGERGGDHVDDRARPGRLAGAAVQLHGEHRAVGERARHVGRHVVQEAAVHQQPAAEGDGLEDARYAAARPDRAREVARAQHHLLARADVDGDRGEGEEQILEALRRRSRARGSAPAARWRACPCAARRAARGPPTAGGAPRRASSASRGPRPARRPRRCRRSCRRRRARGCPPRRAPSARRCGRCPARRRRRGRARHRRTAAARWWSWMAESVVAGAGTRSSRRVPRPLLYFHGFFP